MINIELIQKDYESLLEVLKSHGSHLFEEMEEIEIVGRDDEMALNDARTEYETTTRLWELIQEQRPFFIVVYEVSREYGGPEEGGWWFDNWSSPSWVATYREEDEAMLVVKLLNEDEKRTKKEAGELDRFSMAGTSDRRYIVEQEVGASETKGWPHYE
jgi:hypothetical protein